MRITYANLRVEKYFSDFNKLKRKLPIEWVRIIKKHLDNLEAAECFGDFLKLGVGKPELLTGYKQIRYSLRISANIRLIIGRVDKVIYILVWANKKDAMRRHSAYFIILFRFMAAADKRQWSSAASMPRRKTRVKLCPRFCAANVPSHQICRSFSASRYSGL